MSHLWVQSSTHHLPRVRGDVVGIAEFIIGRASRDPLAPPILPADMGHWRRFDRRPTTSAPDR
jgi:hypothetical protein